MEIDVNPRNLLACGMGMPAAYLITCLVAGGLYPDYDWLRQPPSELGRITAASSLAFNAGLTLTALLGILGALGLLASIKQIHNGRIWACLAAVCLLLSSIGLAFAGIFPLPDPLHYGYGLGFMAIPFPLLGAMALWRQRHAGPASPALALGLVFAAIVGLLVAQAPPVLAGMLMLWTVAFLCRKMHA